MHSAVELRADHDLTDVPAIVRGAVKLGLLESVLVLVISLVSRFLPNGVLQTAVLGVIVLVGLFAVTFLPGLWTRPRTIEGIAGAAGIGQLLRGKGNAVLENVGFLLFRPLISEGGEALEFFLVDHAAV